MKRLVFSEDLSRVGVLPVSSGGFICVTSWDGAWYPRILCVISDRSLCVVVRIQCVSRLSEEFFSGHNVLRPPAMPKFNDCICISHVVLSHLMHEHTPPCLHFLHVPISQFILAPIPNSLLPYLPGLV